VFRSSEDYRRNKVGLLLLQILILVRGQGKLGFARITSSQARSAEP